MILWLILPLLLQLFGALALVLLAVHRFNCFSCHTPRGVALAWLGVGTVAALIVLDTLARALQHQLQPDWMLGGLLAVVALALLTDRRRTRLPNVIRHLRAERLGVAAEGDGLHIHYHLQRKGRRT